MAMRRGASMTLRTAWKLVFGLLILVRPAGPAAERSPGSPGVPSVRRSSVPRLDAAFGRMALSFIANSGQLDRQVDYYIAGKDMNIYFGKGGLTIALSRPGAAGGDERRHIDGRPGPAPSKIEAGEARRWAVKLDFVGANPDVRPAGEAKTETVFSFFRGGREDWRTGIPSFSRLVYQDLWPGIDLVYYGTADRLKYEFIVWPGADPSAIRLAYTGATAVRLNKSGELEVETPLGGFRDEKPVAYQERRGERFAVLMAYHLEEDKTSTGQGSEGEGVPLLQGRSHGFEVGEYDRSLPLVVDPATVVYSGFLGGSADDRGTAIAIDDSGNAYITGSTGSYDFPVAAGPDPTFNSQTAATDAFVAKVSPDGATLLYCGFIGGALEDAGTGIAVNIRGNAYVCGWTFSPDFPAVLGPGLTPHGDITAHSDAFVARLSADGSSLEYCGFIGGTNDDRAMGIATNGWNAYLTGWTASADFPAVGESGSTFMGDRDAFVTLVNWEGTGFYRSLFLGGQRSDEGTGIGIDCCGYIYITGNTDSSPADGFPASPGPPLSYGGNRDAFVAKIRDTIEYCGYIGGVGTDESAAIAVDYFGDFYVVGTTDSGEGFPVKSGPGLVHAGGNDVFVAKLSIGPYAKALDYCGFIGGPGDDRGLAIALDSSGRAYVAGSTDSASGFPVIGGPSLALAGMRDAFLAEVNFKGRPLLYCGFLGGSGNDEAAGIAADEAGNVYVAGTTRSNDFPAAVGPILIPGAGLSGESDDAFVARVFEEPPPTPPWELKGAALSTTEIVITWIDRSTNESGFKISRRDESINDWVEVGSVGADVTTFTDIGLTEATSYTYSVQAYSDVGDSTYSVIAIQYTRPEAPTNLMATAVNERRVDLSWVDNSHGEDGVLVLRRDQSSSYWQIVARLPANATACSDDYWVSGNRTYSYCVKASVNNTDSVPSAEAEVTTPQETLPAAPTDLLATAPLPTQVNLSWVDNAYNELWYSIERKTGAGGAWIEVATIRTDSTAWLDTTVIDRTTYYYRVRAFNSPGFSEYSNEAMVTTPPHQPHLRLPIRSVSFNTVDECATWIATTVIYNDGEVPLVVSGISFASGAEGFRYLGPKTPFTIDPHWGQELGFQFAPLDPGGWVTGVFTIRSNDPVNGNAPLEATAFSQIPFITMNLQGQRLFERAWLVRRAYARISLALTSTSPWGGVAYRLVRRTGAGPYQRIKTFSWVDTYLGIWTYADYFLAADVNYSYKVEAVDCRGVVIHESQEIELPAPAPQPPPKQTTRKVIK